MANLTINISVHVAWWVPIYLNTLKFVCVVMRAEPNWNKVEYWVRKGMKANVT